MRVFLDTNILCSQELQFINNITHHLGHSSHHTQVPVPVTNGRLIPTRPRNSSPRPRRWPSCATRPTSARRRRIGRSNPSSYYIKEVEPLWFHLFFVTKPHRHTVSEAFRMLLYYFIIRKSFKKLHNPTTFTIFAPMKRKIRTYYEPSTVEISIVCSSSSTKARLWCFSTDSKRKPKRRH